jgi:hypothetical protein
MHVVDVRVNLFSGRVLPKIDNHSLTLSPLKYASRTPGITRGISPLDLYTLYTNNPLQP